MKQLVCIVCPNGCALIVNEAGEVSGNKCPRGREFAQKELTAPMRTLCTTVRTGFSAVPVLPVRLSREVPKSEIFEIMREINRVTVKTKLNRGDVVIKNAAKTGADVVAASDILTKI